ncbi:glycosyltransferase family 4 protein [Runella sp.]|uniref:glycosyltransferase family 4 protein n=1 Tax=Runella sp. TaxID=1960881 RepID=UPI00301741BA
MSKKKFLIISLGRKALEEHTKNMALCFSTNDFDLICSRYSETDYQIPNIVFTTKTYQSLVSFIINSIFILPIFLLRLLKIHRHYDIVYFPTVHPWNFAIIVLWRLLGKKTILTIHDAELHPGEENIVLQLSLKFSMRLTSHLLFLTNYVQKTAYKKLSLKTPFRIIPQGLLPLPDIELRNTRKGKNILFLGRISKYKGVDLLIKAVNEMPVDSYDSLTIAGMPIYDVTIPKDNPKIKLHAKYMSEKEMSNFLNQADIIVLPYIEASQSGVILLATLAEKPIICSRVGGLNEQLSNEECLFINPQKEEIKNAIRELLTNDLLYSSIQTALKKKKKDLTWDSKAKLLMNYIDDIRLKKI